MRFLALGVMAGLVSGCVTVEKTFSDTVSSEGILVFQGDSQSGDITYDGSAIREEFEIFGRSHGFGASKKKASRREEGNDYFVERQGEFLVAAASSAEAGRAGVDFDVVGPALMHVDIIADDGAARLFNVDGDHVVTASSVYGRGVVGNADMFATGSGMDMEIFPYEFGIVRLEANGDTDVFLPWGMDYDLNIIGDPQYELVLEDLGFDTVVLEPGLGIGWRGSRTVRVDVFVTGGDTRIFSAN